MKEETVGRWILTFEGIKKGYLRLDGDSLVEVCWGDAPTGSKGVLITPAFVNAHTHIGDSVAFPAPKGSVREIVAPPDGYKHKVLRAKSASEKTEAMRKAVQEMGSSGTALFCDFREEGVEGLRSFRNALSTGWPRAIVLGRPVGPASSPGEIEGLLSASDGLGLSAISDWPIDQLERLSRDAKAKEKMFALHASEVIREDIDSILDIGPDFLVHMCKASDDDLDACRDAEIPVVVCPSSNRFFGIDSNLHRLLKAGVTVGLGTDNGMIVRPSILSELKVAYAVSAAKGKISPLEIVRLAIFGARKVLNVDAKITTEISEDSDLLAIRTTGEDPLSDLVTRSMPEDIIAMARGGRVGRTGSWMT